MKGGGLFPMARLFKSRLTLTLLNSVSIGNFKLQSESSHIQNLRQNKFTGILILKAIERNSKLTLTLG